MSHNIARLSLSWAVRTPSLLIEHFAPFVTPGIQTRNETKNSRPQSNGPLDKRKLKLSSNGPVTYISSADKSYRRKSYLTT